MQESATALRRAARAILAESRFHEHTLPRPLHGVLTDFGNLLESPLHAFSRLVDRIGSWFPGGVNGVWVGLALAVLVISLMAARRRARFALARQPAGPALGSRSPDPTELERLAADAERRGALNDAVRLRFRAGLLRLHKQRAVPDADALLTADVSQALASNEFDLLARRFDEIAYGESEATPDDVREQRDGWPKILARARR